MALVDEVFEISGKTDVNVLDVRFIMIRLGNDASKTLRACKALQHRQANTVLEAIEFVRQNDERIARSG